MTPADLREGREISGAHMEILHPVEGLLSKKSNDNSLVMRISSGGTSFLFPGDLEAAGEQMLISRWFQTEKRRSSRPSSRKQKLQLRAVSRSGKSQSVCYLLRAGNPFGFPVTRFSKGSEVMVQDVEVDEVGPLRSPLGRRGPVRTSGVPRAYCNE